ncbi:hypothetical protein CBS14141_000317 [Malassezia furfur]|nr:hypothetical protein CBS14141_000317 [Malassezia furfur]
MVGAGLGASATNAVPLHNALVLSMLAAASAPPRHAGRGVPGTTAAPTSPIRVRDASLLDSDADEDLEHEPPVNGIDTRSSKRLRHMYAGLSQRERARLQQLPTGSQSGVHTAATVWAGAGAELLEKKRKEDEKRKAVEERRRTREAKSAIGAVSWRAHAVQSAVQTDTIRARLSNTMQDTFARGVMVPHCVEMHELPDVHTLQDRMTFTAVEAGLAEGVHVQAAAVVLAALEDHLRNIISSALARVRGPSRGDAHASTFGRLKMPDMAALLDLSPHVVVEPLGQGALERLLTPDLDDSVAPTSSGPAAESWAPEEALARYAQACATAKLADSAAATPPTDPSADAAMRMRQQLQNQRDSVRNRVLLDQLAPLRMLDRPAIAEAMAHHEDLAVEVRRPHPSTALGQALAQHYQSGTHHHHHHHAHPNPTHRHKDEFFDVVDPAALLGQLCE